MAACIRNRTGTDRKQKTDEDCCSWCLQEESSFLQQPAIAEIGVVIDCQAAEERFFWQTSVFAELTILC